MGGDREPEATGSDRDRIVACLARHGRSAVAPWAREPSSRIWLDPEVDAAVAYCAVRGAWIAAGEPIASTAASHGEDVAARFLDAARSRGRTVRFFGVESAFGASTGEPAWRRLPIGVQPVWDPRNWRDVLDRKASLREQLRRARAKGVQVRPVARAEFASGTALRSRADELLDRWRAARRMAPMGFVVAIDWPGRLDDSRRVWIAVCGDELVGVLVSSSIPARDGWLLEHVLRDPAAPNGTVELLIDRAFRDLARSGAAEVTFGLAPLVGDGIPRWLAWVRDRTGWLYDFRGLEAFKAKLDPDRWDAVTLVFPRGDSAVGAIRDVLRAFAGGSLLAFGWRSLVHRARLVVAILAWLLLPWTVLLIACDGPRWFPSPVVQGAWIAFDVVLFALLLRLAARGTALLAIQTAAFAAVDFALGLLQAVTHNLVAPGVVDVVAVAAALAAPAFAAVFLWSARRRWPMRSESQPTA